MSKLDNHSKRGLGIFFIALLVAAILVTIQAGRKSNLPTAKELLTTVSMPQVPKTVTQDTVKNFLSDELSVSVIGDIDIHYVEKKNQSTIDMGYSLPFTGTLDIYTMEDGRNLISVGGVMDYGLSGPYIDDINSHYEKSYFVIVNDDLASADIFMRELSPDTVSDNSAGNWQFVNDRELDLAAVIDQYNKDHAADYTDSASMNKAVEGLKDMIARSAKVTEGKYRGTDCYVLTNKFDFKDKKTLARAQEFFASLQSFDSTFHHLNLSQFLEYYGEFTVINMQMYFSKNDDPRLLACRFDLSELRFAEYLSKMLGKDIKEIRDTVSFDVNSMYCDIVFLPAVPDSIKQTMEDLVDYSDKRILDMQTVSSNNAAE